MQGLRTNVALTGRRFHAWWEGYAFDAAVERNRLARAHGFSATRGNEGVRAEDEIAQAIWGAGRLEPGDPLWSMRCARTLSVPLRSRVVVLGAGAGGPLRDLKSATKWRLSGLSRYRGPARGVDLKSYDQVMSRMNKAAAHGAISLFELHRDPDPQAFVMFASELIAPGAPATFIDFTMARKTGRLKSCFSAPWSGAPRQAGDYEAMLKKAGYAVHDVSDDTRAFLPLISAGWANWQSAYNEALAVQDAELRGVFLQTLARYAHLWAERRDALKAGQLLVTRFQAQKPR
ncbi:MAG: hypothetical protein AAGJ87_14865 [Pseudomonadota bacterium]